MNGERMNVAYVVGEDIHFGSFNVENGGDLRSDFIGFSAEEIGTLAKVGVFFCRRFK